MNIETDLEKLLVSELATAELRAKRSLRVLQHQENRITNLEKVHEFTNFMQRNIVTNSGLLQELQNEHADLLQVHRYQKDVQELQKELIRLQEIQYTTELTNLENTKLSNLSPPPLEIIPNVGADNLSTGKLVDTPSTPTDERVCNSKSKDDDTSIQAGSGAPTTSTSSFQSLGSSLGSLLDFLKTSVAQANRVQAPSSKQDVSPGALVQKNETQSQERNTMIEEHANAMYAQTNKCFKVDGEEDDDKITLLRETLSSHRQSIENLSGEVLQLRSERVELMSYLNNLLSWRMKVEQVLDESVSARNGTRTNLRNGSTPVCADSRRNPVTYVNEETDEEDANSNYSGLEHVDDEKYRRGDGVFKERKLEEKANRMWTTACRFFTPQQAHFILTAPMPHEVEFQELDDDDDRY